MITISIYQQEEFWDFLDTHINRDDFRYKYLIAALDAISEATGPIITSNTLILKKEESWIVYIETDGQLFLYGNYDEELLTELSSKIKLNSLNDYEIMGEYSLVFKLLNLQKVIGYSIIKNRLFYILRKSEQLLPLSESQKPAQLSDLNEISQMMMEYYKEEYAGERNKTIDQISLIVLAHIQTQTILVYKSNNSIQGFCTLINPDIGILYTKPQYRNQQIGRKLLSAASTILFKLNEVCYLMTDENNPASNRLCLDLGYEEIYNHTNIKLG